MKVKARWPGDWLAICDRCGWQYPSSRLRKDWQGLMVCEKDYETRHPQELLRVRDESVVPPWTRPEPDDDFVFVCYIWALSCYAGLAQAGCAQAGNINQPYQFLLDLSENE